MSRIGKIAHLVMDRERWDLEHARLEEEQSDRERDETRSKLTAPVLAALHLNSMAKAFGGGEAGEKMPPTCCRLSMILSLEPSTGRTLPALPDLNRPNPIRVNQT